MSDPFRKYAFLFLTGLWLVTLIGIKSIPLETHEVYVLETAQEMQTSGDWILPHFNQMLRLQKPPLNYWATAFISKLDPFSTDIQIWHGRLVSLLAGLLMVLVTGRMGTAIYGRETGLMAAALLMSTQGFIHLSHSARPDFLYAAFCVLQLFAWMEAWKADNGTRRQLWSSLLGWAAAALATLTKGPQVPAVFLTGLLIFLLTGPERKRTIHILRPLSGAALFCVIVLPWWFLLNRRLQALGVNIADSQLSGSLLHNLADRKELLSGYYLRTLFVLLLPASLSIPIILPELWKNRDTKSDVTRLLIIISVTFLIVFTLGGHYRKHYLLPLLPVFSLFLARAVDVLPLAALKNRWQKILLIALGALAALGCVGLLIYREAYGMLLILPVYMLPLFFLLKKTLAANRWKNHPLAPRLLSFAVLVTILLSGYNAFLPITPHRASEQAFSEYIGRSLKPEDILVEWNSSLDILPYYAKRGVVSYTDGEKLKNFLAENNAGRPVFAVLPVGELTWFSSTFENDVLESTRNYRKNEQDLVFVKILSVKNREKPAQPEKAILKQADSGMLDILFLLFFLACPRSLDTL